MQLSQEFTLFEKNGDSSVNKGILDELGCWGRAGLGRTRPNRAGLGRIGPNWAGLGWAELGRIGLWGRSAIGQIWRVAGPSRTLGHRAGLGRCWIGYWARGCRLGATVPGGQELSEGGSRWLRGGFGFWKASGGPLEMSRDHLGSDPVRERTREQRTEDELGTSWAQPQGTSVGSVKVARR
ncbi:hypothetical protein CRG98_039815 [Punica granatum]|uniref:Uncharacterized protein n=1 Tax=Punica granatum TaxID=22663 RepID=A0A2I0I7Z1_PUNGR|nr:hypothetical protein CRG98_039815 [Punica granatum]